MERREVLKSLGACLGATALVVPETQAAQPKIYGWVHKRVIVFNVDMKILITGVVKRHAGEEVVYLNLFKEGENYNGEGGNDKRGMPAKEWAEHCQKCFAEKKSRLFSL